MPALQYNERSELVVVKTESDYHAEAMAQDDARIARRSASDLSTRVAQLEREVERLSAIVASLM